MRQDAPDGFPQFSPSNLFFVHVEAAAAFRTRKDAPIVLRMDTEQGRADLSVCTEYAETSGLPQTIVSAKIFANGDDLSQVGVTWLNHAAGILNAIALATNAAIMEVEPLYCVDISEGRTNRPFFQNESRLLRPNIPSESRLVDAEAAMEFASLLVNQFENRDRLVRATQQYVLALRYATPYSKAMAIVHAFIAAETLVPIATRHLLNTLNITAEELTSLGAKDMKWKWPLNRSNDANNVAGWYARKRVVFHDDRATHKKAKELSDGFEHGFGRFADIIKAAEEVFEPTMSHIRRAIIELSPLTSTLKNRLIEEERFRKPLAIFSQRMLNGQLSDVPGTDETSPPVTFSQGEPDVSYNEITGQYKFDVANRLISRRNVKNGQVIMRP